MRVKPAAVNIRIRHVGFFNFHVGSYSASAPVRSADVPSAMVNPGLNQKEVFNVFATCA